MASSPSGTLKRSGTAFDLASSPSTTGSGAVSSTFAAYYLRFLGHDPSAEPYATQVHYIAAIAIALTATFNYVGVAWSSLILNITTLAKYGGLLFIIGLAFFIGLPILCVLSYLWIKGAI